MKSAKMKFYWTDILIIITIALMIVITVTGLLSFSPGHGYMVTNQYGNPVKLFGNGIYAHDSYFKAPIFIGSDCTMLLMVVPLLGWSLIKNIRNHTVKSDLLLISIMGTVLYYAASIAFGVTYNSFQLLYIALFSCSLFTLFKLIRNINTDQLREKQQWQLPSKGLYVFLILSGASLFVAWMPDILVSLFSGKPLTMIEVYTTEITYVLDMGLVSPLMFICLYLLKKKQALGDIILAILLKACVIIGVMLPVQSVFQIAAGISIPIPALITKAGIFVVLAVFAFYFDRKLYRNITG